MQTRFWKFSTAGNTTLFVDDKAALRPALDIIGAEQAGAIKCECLEMAGDEMCVNACLAFGCLMHLLGRQAKLMRICNQEIDVEASGEIPDWQCSASFPLNEFGCEYKDECRVIHLSGISHALVECGEFPAYADAITAAQSMMHELGLESVPASGIIWWRRSGGILEIMPVVSVPGAGTCNVEAACGSGSLALALCLPQGSHEIVQPSGEKLIVSVDRGRVCVEAHTSLLAQGILWF